MFYHIRVSAKYPRIHSIAEYKLDLSLDELESRYLRDYYTADAITINGRTIPWLEISRIYISRTERESKHYTEQAQGVQRLYGSKAKALGWYIVGCGTNVTDDYITGSPGSKRESIVTSKPLPRPDGRVREVFVVHGRDSRNRNAMFDFLNSLDLRPLEWSEVVVRTGKTAPYIGEVLDVAFSKAHAVVVVFTPDDEARLRRKFVTEDDTAEETQLSGQARPNVLFEAGMAMGRSAERTVLVEIGRLRPFSDIAGRHVIRFDGSTEGRQALAQRLQAAGCPASLAGLHWQKAGNFEISELAFGAGRADSDLHQASAAGAEEHTEVIPHEAIELLRAAAGSSDGRIVVVRVGVAQFFHTARGRFGTETDARTRALWQKAFGVLVEAGFIADATGDGKQFVVTDAGFRFVDELQD